MLLIFLDTETTGLNPEKHRILNIAYKIIDSMTHQPLLSYDAIIAQPLEIFAAADPESLKVNGFTREKVMKGKTERAVAAEIINDFNKAGLKEKSGVFICQNPSFDRAFFAQLISVEEQDLFEWPYHWLDLASMFFAKRLLQDRNNLKNMSESMLSKNSIATYYGLPNEEEPHLAMNGVNHLISCFEAIFK